MKITGQGKLLRILIGESDRVHGRPLYSALVEKAHELGLAGATAWRGIEGFGARSRIHTARILRLSEDLPVVIEIVDSEEKIREALPALDALMEAAGGGGLITLEAAEVIKYTHGGGDRAALRPALRGSDGGGRAARRRRRRPPPPP